MDIFQNKQLYGLLLLGLLFLAGSMAAAKSHALAPESAVSNQEVGPMISVMVLYTPEVRRTEGSAAGVRASIDNVVATTNQTYENSGINQRIHLVYSGEINYQESQNINKDLDRLLDPNDNHLDQVHDLRDKYAADIVVLWVDPFYYTPGKAGNTRRLDRASDADEAFAVVAARLRFDRREDNYTFAHELGHIMGASHDRTANGNGVTPFPYSYGYVNETAGLRTIMAQNDVCDENGAWCNRVPFWSNPEIRYFGERLGWGEGNPRSADNRKTLNNTASIVAGFRTLGTNENLDRYGEAVASGDFDGDGYDDLVVGAPREALGSGNRSGIIFTYHGTPFGLAPWTSLDQAGLGGNEDGDRFGYSLTTGDFNGDGRDDLAVGAPTEAPSADPQSGYVFIFKGTSNGLQPWHGLDQAGIGGNEADDRFGWSLASGDFDGDGRDDLAVGGPGEAPASDPKSGYVFIFRGRSNGLVAWHGLDQSGLGGNERYDSFGEALAAGDFNGDGRDDLAVGAVGESKGGRPQSGWVYTFSGSSQGLRAWQSIGQDPIGGDEEGDKFGAALTAADFNGDGRDDLAVGAVGESKGSRPQSGWVYTFSGSSQGLTAWQSIGQDSLGSNERGDLFGQALAAADLNGDGRYELIVGAPGENQKTGWAFVYRGTQGDLRPWHSVGQRGMGADEEGDRFAWSLAAGDFNNDDYDDFAAGAPGEAPGSDPRSGYVFTYEGTSSGPIPIRGLHQEQ